MDQNAKQYFENAVEGLLMMSESDYPFEVIQVSGNTIDETLVLQLSGKPLGTAIEQTDIDHLFRNLIKTYPESRPEEMVRADRFKHLMMALRTKLSELKVYRIGEIQVGVFVLGFSGEGEITGLKTQLIET